MIDSKARQRLLQYVGQGWSDEETIQVMRKAGDEHLKKTAVLKWPK